MELINPPWIGILHPDGTEVFVGLKEALTDAHLFRAIRDPMPTVEFGLYRLLSALVLDIFFIDGYDEEEPPTLRDLREVLRVGHFDPDKIAAYFAKYAHLFDLFDKDNPFLQMAEMETEPPKPLAGLVHPQPSGTNAAHFHHAREDAFGVSPAAAARLLTTIAPFMTAGGAGLSPSINGAPPWYCLVLGKTLFETICCNLCLLPGYADSLGVPSWRDTRRNIGGDRRTGAGYAEALTWRPRRIQLISGPSGVCSLTGMSSEVLVRTMRFAAGDSCGFPNDLPYKDANVAYRSNPPKGPIAFRPQEGRPVWRDTGALLLFKKGQEGEKRSERPRVIDLFKELKESSGRNANEKLDVVLYGMRTDMKMKVFEWQKEPLHLPADLLWNTTAQQEAEGAMEKADAVAGAVRYAIKKAYPRDGAGNKGAFDARIGQALRAFWGDLRPDYDHLLMVLAKIDPDEDEEAAAQQKRAAQQKWVAQMRRSAWGVLNEAIDDLDSNADALERWAKARADFAKRLVRLIPREKEEM